MSSLTVGNSAETERITITERIWLLLATAGAEEEEKRMHHTPVKAGLATHMCCDVDSWILICFQVSTFHIIDFGVILRGNTLKSLRGESCS